MTLLKQMVNAIVVIFLPLMILGVHNSAQVAQAADTISGTVLGDSGSTGTLLPLDSVKISCADNSAILPVFSQPDGSFKLELAPTSAIESRNILLKKNGTKLHWLSQSPLVEISVLSEKGETLYIKNENGTNGSFALPGLASGIYWIRLKTLAHDSAFFRYTQQRSREFKISPALLARSMASGCTLKFEKIPYVTKTEKIQAGAAPLNVVMTQTQKVVSPFFGFNFSPYVNDQDPNTGVLVPEQQIIDRMSIVAPYTNTVRSFSSTHGQEVVGKIAKKFGLKTYIGAWFGSNLTDNEKEFQNAVTIAKNGEADAVILGSETILRGDLTESKLIEYITRFKAAVPNVPVATADVYGSFMGHPNLIKASDFIFANIYPYWEGSNITYAVANLNRAYESLVSLAQGKEVMISETGWPSEGDALADAVPSALNASQYFMNVASWAKEKNVKVFYFEAFDEKWKTAEGAVGAHWGVFDTEGSLKNDFDRTFKGETVADNWSGIDEVDGPGTPTLTITSVPEYGIKGSIKGKVSHIIPKDYAIAIYIFVPGAGWWQKPTNAAPLTSVQVDGTWSCYFTTGGTDENATEIRAYLLPAGYSPPPNMSLLPADKIITQGSIVRAAKVIP